MTAAEMKSEVTTLNENINYWKVYLAYGQIIDSKTKLILSGVPFEEAMRDFPPQNDIEREVYNDKKKTFERFLKSKTAKIQGYAYDSSRND